MSVVVVAAVAAVVLTGDDNRRPRLLAETEDLLLHLPRELLAEFSDALLQRLRRELFGVE